MDDGTEIRLTDPKMIQDDATYCCAFFMGSIAPKTEEIKAEMMNWYDVTLEQATLDINKIITALKESGVIEN